MADERVVTILGCGIAGSWTAHHLAKDGIRRFVLFGGAQPSAELYRLGANSGTTSANTTAEFLAAHLTKLCDDLDVSVLGDYNTSKHETVLAGSVVGAMGSMPGCMAAFRASQERNLQWHSIGLPTTERGSIAIVTNPYDLDPDEHFGVTCLSRTEIDVACAKFATVVSRQTE